jgi:hypothetical protein
MEDRLSRCALLIVGPRRIKNALADFQHIER